MPVYTVPAIEKATCRKISWGVCTLDRMLALAPLPRSATTRFMPRLMRTVTGRATPVREDRNVQRGNAARAPSDPALPIDNARRVSIDIIYQRHPPASSFELETQPPLPPVPYAGHHRRVATSRLANPARFGAHASAASSRLLRAALPSSSALPRTWDKDSPSPSSCASSALGSAATAWSVHAPTRMGLSRDAPRLVSALAIPPRNRNRGLSVGD
jgi:hypothetical protein